MNTTKTTLLVVLSLASACGNAPPPTCDDGMTRAVPCGMCGTISEICNGGAWEPQTVCLGEGECAPGAVETDPLPRCAEQQRVCDTECSWTEWTETSPPLDCDPGETRLDPADCPMDRFRPQTCTESCAWQSMGDCVDACGGEPRTMPVVKEEICIPAGPFIRGSDEIDDYFASPIQTVTLSAYYIDRYPVTNDRYRECVDAGVCAIPAQSGGADAFANPLRADHPVWGVTWDQARAFCDWDGGRRILTEAEWEKAARGPAPRMNLYPWDGDAYRCDLFPCQQCQPVPVETDVYYAFPGAASYYGVEMTLGGGQQWVLDYHSQTYYADPASLVDPQGPDTGTERVVRSKFRSQSGFNDHITTRYYAPPANVYAAIRCGRDAEAF